MIPFWYWDVNLSKAEEWTFIVKFEEVKMKKLKRQIHTYVRSEKKREIEQVNEVFEQVNEIFRKN